MATACPDSCTAAPCTGTVICDNDPATVCPAAETVCPDSCKDCGSADLLCDKDADFCDDAATICSGQCPPALEGMPVAPNPANDWQIQASLNNIKTGMCLKFTRLSGVTDDVWLQDTTRDNWAVIDSAEGVTVHAPENNTFYYEDEYETFPDNAPTSNYSCDADCSVTFACFKGTDKDSATEVNCHDVLQLQIATCGDLCDCAPCPPQPPTDCAVDCPCATTCPITPARCDAECPCDIECRDDCATCPLDCAVAGQRCVLKIGTRKAG